MFNQEYLRRSVRLQPVPSEPHVVRLRSIPSETTSSQTGSVRLESVASETASSQTHYSSSDQDDTDTASTRPSLASPINLPNRPASFPAAPPTSIPAAAPPTAVDLLRLACLRGDLSTLPHLIAATVNPPAGGILPPPNVLRHLLSILTALGVDFSGAHAALAEGPPPPPFRCTRCNRAFRAAENHPAACVVPHKPALVCRDPGAAVGFVEGVYETRYYSCCGTAEVVHPSDPGGRACFVGWHTTQEVVDGGRQVQVPFPPLYAAGLQASTSATRTASPVQPPVPRRNSLNAGRPRPGTEHRAQEPSVSHHEGLHRQVTLVRGHPPKIIETIPWKESSLYHPPGWVSIPSALRRPGCPPYV